MTSHLSRQPVTALRARMIEDMTVRGFTEDTRTDYVRRVRAFAAFLRRSPDTATAEGLRRFQLHQRQSGMQPPSIKNSAVAALRFFFTVTLDRPDLARRLTMVREPRRLPAVLSVEEVTLLPQAAPGAKYKAVPLLTVGHVDGDALSFRQAHDPGTLQHRSVHEDILTAPIGADEAKPLAGVVPLYGTKFLDLGSIDRRICRAFRPCPPRLLLRRGTDIHTEDLRHLRPLRSGPGAHLKRRAGRHAAVAAAFDDAHVQEGIARTVGQFDEAEALIRVVPLDGTSDGRAGGAVELWTARRRVSEIAGRLFVVVIVETAATGRAKIPLPIAHVGILSEFTVSLGGARAIVNAQKAGADFTAARCTVTDEL